MNKKQRPSDKGRKQAAVGVAICFAAVIALTGAYTWTNYKASTEKELELAQEEQRARQEAANKALREANNIAEKAKEETKPEETDSTAENNTSEQSEQSEQKPEDTADGAAGQSSTQTSGNASQLSFGESSQMLWPVNGHVTMSYSMDKTVYFATLDQYKYNPAVIIAGTVNDNVIASAPGVIKSIDVLPQTGTTVTVDMGNGYECLYGQLKEVPVKVGDYVEAGNVLGYLSEPTKYYSVEGCNLYFEMHKDGQPVNPMDYMAEE